MNFLKCYSKNILLEKVYVIMNIKNFLKHNSTKAFTLLELLLVIAIVAVMAALIIFNVRPTEILTDTRDTERQVEKESLKKAFNAYITAESLSGGATVVQGLSNGVYDICKQGETNCTSESINVDDLISKGYLSKVPDDPDCTSSTETCYNIKVTNGGLQVTVLADNDFPNLITGKPITFNQGQVDYLNYTTIYPVANATDNNPATAWRTQTDHSTASEKAILVVDFGKTETIRRVVYYAGWDSLPTFNDGVTIRFSISPNGSAWTQIHEKRLTGTQNGARQNDTLSATYSGRYIRFEYMADGNWSGWGNVNEVSAYEE